MLAVSMPMAKDDGRPAVRQLQLEVTNLERE